MVSDAGGEPKVKKPEEKKEEAKELPETSELAPAAEITDGAEGTPAGGVRSSPLARRIAEDQEIDLTKVEGSGTLG